MKLSNHQQAGYSKNEKRQRKTEQVIVKRERNPYCDEFLNGKIADCPTLSADATAWCGMCVKWEKR